MSMNRREAIKGLSLGLAQISGLGLSVNAYALFQERDGDPIIPAQYRALISQIADTLLPEVDGKGALAQKVDVFLVNLFEQCYEEDKQALLINQLSHLDERAKKDFQKSFGMCSQEQRETLLIAFEQSDDDSEKEFFEIIKKETIKGFETSQVILEQHYGYQVAPGFFKGSVDITNK